MQNVLEFGSSFFSWLVRASWQASVILILVLAVQWLLGKQLSARWRHLLWFFVVLRLALPWTFESQLSLFNLVSFRLKPDMVLSRDAIESAGQDVVAAETVSIATPSQTAHGVGTWKFKLGLLWLAGAVGLPGYLLITSLRAGRIVRRERPITDQAILDLLEDCKADMGVSTPLSVIETAVVTSPSLFGFIRPRLLLPRGFTKSFSLAELRYVFLHEVAHIRRNDIALNWLATLAVVLHWFNPLVWFAVSRMRVDGELACDALALSHAGEAENKPYGQTIIKLLEHFSRPAAGPGLVGILENQHQMKRRISMIASFNKGRTWPAVAVAVFIALGLVTLTDAQSNSATGASASKDSSNSGPSADVNGPPQIIATSPQVGTTEVDPNLTQISVTFDRDMAGGFSWTGGGPDFPTGPEGQKPRWVDRRTCVFPVNLEPARYYRVGINSKSYRNFRSSEGVPARPSAIYFTTQGASQDLKDKVVKPQIVHIYPPNGATDVDPALNQITVTFNLPMGGGFSWTGGGPQFPTIPEGKQAYWAIGQKTCVLPVELTPGTEYKIGLNSPSHNNFQSAAGVPFDPVVYTFKTRQ